jgi:putative thioredoxin
MTIVITALNSFEADVVETSLRQPVLVDFWAEWCAPCLVIAPVLEQVVAELEGRLVLAKLEVDEGENMKLAGRYRVRGFPTVMLFYGGSEVARFSGARSRSQIMEFLHSHLDLVNSV